MPKTMKIKVSKTMVKFLNEGAENMDFHYIACNGEKKILVTYPPEYYALPAVLTDEDLLEGFYNSSRDAESFKRQIYNMVEI